MREIDYNPLCLQKEGALLEGQLRLSAPSLPQRMAYMEAINLKVKEDGTVDLGLANMGAIGKMLELSKGHYLSVDIKARDGSKEFKSYDEMILDPDCDDVLMEVAGVILHGLRPSKKANP